MKKDNTYIIENERIKKLFTFRRGRLVSCVIENRLSDRSYTALEGSEEFILNFNVGLFLKKSVPSSSLKLTSYEEKTGGYIFTFEPFKVADSKISLRLIYKVKPFTSYINKYIELSFKEKGDKPIILDFIEHERFIFDSALSSWCIPEQKDSHIRGEALELGQPVYVGSLFFGVEFPVSYNKIEKGGTTLRTYSGKSLQELIGEGTYKSRSTVIGVSPSDDFILRQKAFFDYIKDIAKPAGLRRQYNSWYDHRLDISKENLTESFLEIEKALTAVGEKPLDSYVCDDGWNDYTKDFWCFNSKFPDELYPMRDISEILGSKFGLWLGPRGGYTSDTPKFAKQVERAGNGYYNKQAQDICVASDKYVEKTGNMILDFQRRFSLNYWKLDGFARYPCKNKKHGHLVGGFHNMYFYNDSWEKWLSVFERMYADNESLWINLTSYAWCSPWFLMYANCLWMQISDDHGFIGKKGEVSDKDRVITYRDERYFDFCRERQFQFPLSRLYNHDPIYANEAGFKMGDEAFREYLFANAMRGTRFWELYYSYDLMNKEKWRINYSVLRFAEDNANALYSPVVFGSSPKEGKVYGFSCFAPTEGVVSLRNSGKLQQEYTLRLDESIGVSTNFAGCLTQLLPFKGETDGAVYHYGDTMKVSLAPYEMKLFHFGRTKKPMEAVFSKAISEKELEITFNQFVNLSEIKCEDNPVTDVKVCEDYMTAVLTFEKPFKSKNSLELKNVGDISGGLFEVHSEFCYYADGIFPDGIFGAEDFSIKVNLDGEGEQVLYSQGEEICLEVGADGYIRFKVGAAYLKSKSTVRDVVQVVAVRERNGLLKLYLNGKPDSGAPCLMTNIKAEKGVAFNSNRVVLYTKALSYDNV